MDNSRVWERSLFYPTVLYPWTLRGMTQRISTPLLSSDYRITHGRIDLLLEPGNLKRRPYFRVMKEKRQKRDASLCAFSRFSRSRQSLSYFLSCATYVVKWLCNLFHTPLSLAPSPIHTPPPPQLLTGLFERLSFPLLFSCLLLVLVPRDYSYQFLWPASYRTECFVLPITVRSKWLKVGIKIKIARDRHRSWEVHLVLKHVSSVK